MLQKGYIEEVINKYSARVRVPKYDKLASSADGTRTEDLAIGVVCTLPGMNITYSAGDVVLVDFENDELRKPIILGLLYTERDSRSVLEIEGIDSNLTSINDKIEELESQNLYTHIKYSDDGGLTFTSLYPASNIVQNQNYTLSPKEKISIDPNTKVIYWSIINEDNLDITNSVSITTNLYGESKARDISLEKTFTQLSDGAIIYPEIPLELVLCDTASLYFTLGISKSVASNYYISLSTDNISVGDTPGKYVGICVSNDKTPSMNTKDYTWAYIGESSGSIIPSGSSSIEDITAEDLLERVRKNEQDLRGYSPDILDSAGKPIDSNIGLLDAIEVTLSSIVLGADRKYIVLGTEKDYVNTSDSSIHINTLTQREFMFKREIRDNVPHLILSVNS